jgi:hypothetical protein
MEEAPDFSFCATSTQDGALYLEVSGHSLARRHLDERLGALLREKADRERPLVSSPSHAFAFSLTNRRDISARLSYGGDD